MAYRLSEKLRAKGKIVIMGGPHFRGRNYSEALDKCDVVASSICQQEWLDLLADIEAGNLEPGAACARHLSDANNKFRYPDNLHESFSSHHWYHVPCVPTSLGCPYNCSYCGPLMPNCYIKRDPAVIYKNMAHMKNKAIVIPDASFGLNKNHVLEIMEAIAPLKKTLYITTTLARISDRELLKALAHGGVRAIAVGIETLNSKLKKHGNVSSQENLRKLIRDCHELGIFLQGNFILGLDTDGPEVFDEVFNFLRSSEMDIVSADVLVPYPHTTLYQTLREQGRIIDYDWSRYDYRHVVYRPLKMTPQDLLQGFASYYKKIVKSRCLMKRLGQVYSRYGLCLESFIVTAYTIFRHLEAIEKSKKFARPPIPLGLPLYEYRKN